MKLRLNKYLRLALICAVLVGIGVVALLLYREAMVPAFKEKKLVHYNYQQRAEANYRVYVKPNLLYNTDNLDEGQTYVTAYVDRVKSYFTYKYQGNQSADITGEYEVKAVVEGFLGEEGKFKTLWKKEFPLVAKTSFTAKDNVNLEQLVWLRLEDYNNFADTIAKSTLVNSQVKLTVFMDVNLRANTSKGVIEKRANPTLQLPLGNKYFEIAKSQVGEEPGTIDELKQVKLPINKVEVSVYGVLLVVMLIILMLLVKFSQTEEKEPFIKALDKIFRDHGDRLVAVRAQKVAAFDHTFQVKSIDDLVRIADEAGKPIFYRYHADPQLISQFYLVDQGCYYFLDLQDLKTVKNTPMTLYNGLDKTHSG